MASPTDLVWPRQKICRFTPSANEDTGETFTCDLGSSSRCVDFEADFDSRDARTEQEQRLQFDSTMISDSEQEQRLQFDSTMVSDSVCFEDTSPEAIAKRFVYYGCSAILWRNIYAVLLFSMGILYIGSTSSSASDLASFAAAASFCSIACVSLGVAFGSAMDVLCSVAVDAQQLHVGWKFLVKGLCVQMWTFAPVSLLLWLACPLFGILGLSPEQSIAASHFLKLATVGLFALFLNEVVSRFILQYGYRWPVVLQHVISLFGVILTFNIMRITAVDLSPLDRIAISFVVAILIGSIVPIVFLIKWRFELGWQSGMKIYLFQLHHSRQGRLNRRMARRDIVPYGLNTIDLPDELGVNLLGSDDLTQEDDDTRCRTPEAAAVTFARRKKRIATGRPDGDAAAAAQAAVKGASSLMVLGQSVPTSPTAPAYITAGGQKPQVEGSTRRLRFGACFTAQPEREGKEKKKR